MAILKLDVRGLASPNCILKVASQIRHMKKGSILEVWADCPFFEKDIRAWCRNTGREILFLESEGESTKKIRIRV